MMRILRFLIPAAAFALMTAHAALAQNPSTMDDKSFVYSMLQQAKGQIRFAGLAQERAQDPRVRDVAAQVHDDWTSLQAALGAIAFADAYPVPGALDADDLAVLDRLGRTRPENFDLSYLQTVNSSFARALFAMNEKSASTSDPKLKALLARTAPLFEHDRRAAEGSGGS